MANVIKLKRGSGSDPSASDLVVGEVAIRTDSGKLFTKKDNGTIAEISGSGGGSDIFINTLSSSSGSGGGSATFNGTATRFTLSNPPSVSAQQLLVSINGVIQKPNSGTSPSEGFAIDGNDIIFAAAPATGSDFFIVTYGSLNIAVPADNSVTSAKIVDGAIVNADINASAAIQGTKISPDFGSQNISTTGNVGIGTTSPSEQLHINSATTTNGLLISSTNNSTRATMELNGKDSSGNEVELRLGGFGDTNRGEIFTKTNHALGFATNNAATQMVLSTSGNLQIPNDSGKLQLGASQDLAIFHDGSNNRIQSTVANTSIYIEGVNYEGSTPFIYLNPRRDQHGLSVKANQGVDLYYDSTKRFETKSYGAFINGHLQMDDNSIIKLGNSNDLQLYHNGTHSFVDEVGNGNLILRTNPSGTYSTLVLQSGRENSVICNKLGSVELYHISGVGSSSKKFETNSAGTTVTGQQIFTNTGVASAYIGANSDGGVFGSDTAGLVFKTGVTGGGSVASTGTTRMTITSSGKIGINNTSPAEKLEVSYPKADVGIVVSTTDTFSSGNSVLMQFREVNTVGGSIAFTNGGTTTAYVTSSDYRLKENVVALTDAITRLKTLKPYRFNFIKTPDTTVDGFLAHEVTAVPEAVTGEKDAMRKIKYTEEDELPKGKNVGDFKEYSTTEIDPQGVDYAKLTPLLTAALQEAITKIETLEIKVAALEAG